MPLYDIRCTGDCGKSEVFVPLSQIDSIQCACGKPAVRLVSPVKTIGAVFDKKLSFGCQTKKSFETNAEYRQYKKDNPNAEFLNKDSKKYRDHYDKVRNHCDSQAKKQGFRDHEDRGKFLKKRKHTANH